MKIRISENESESGNELKLESKKATIHGYYYY